ncbi:Nonsense-mediated mRNA decay protein 5 [Tilletia horrida]|uniref:Nonsense-mediated mRNA decay protein 5 n=1 Tax=Tilletia horrida TaxID=155126 RepID=A0AAN6GFV5_9BASI|nr:Nonsense-mediated mRNA decay protein 5 [Tilletia horrida]KAK0535909.1 Nonsense-mediated mRNA decay protein 5 [Tilletia horrida]KAK0539414.1 Nonsense-mediated mRNA decay protein 5 [Tilletia horrida]KAK0561483.1 Nonsense-mediated mRNA decay protein 5 [Tilletia horrida]
MDTVYQLLGSTLDPNPNVRKAAELEIRKLEPQEGMISAVFQIVASNEADLSVRQAASIYFKNRIMAGWDPAIASRRATLPPGRVGPSGGVVPDAERATIRSGMLPALMQAPPVVRNQIRAALRCIVVCDYPSQWPDLLSTVLQMVGTEEPQTLYAGLTAALEAVRAFRWKNAQSGAMDGIVSALFPTLLATAQKLLQSPNVASPEVGELLYLTLKCYKTSMENHLTKHQQTDESVIPWGQLLLAIVDKDIDASQLPDDDDARELAPWWKAKKWAYFSLNKLFVAYGNPSQLPPAKSHYKPFAERFSQLFAPEVLKVYLRKTEQFVTGQAWLSKRAKRFQFKFYEQCVRPKATWALLKPSANDLVQKFVLPTVSWSAADEELWELDSADYVRSQTEGSDDHASPHFAAKDFLTSLVSKRTKTTLQPQLEFITAVITGYPGTYNASQKDGALSMCSALSTLMVKHPLVANTLDSFVLNHVVPELKSEHRFLRFHACNVIKQFDQEGMHWQSEKTLEAAFTGIMECLHDSELPVRVSAAEALGLLISHDEVRKALAPRAAEVMQILLKLADEADLDNLGQVQQAFFETFQEELLPFAVEVVTQIAATYRRLLLEMEELAETEDGAEITVNQDEADKSFATMNCLATIFQVVDAAQNSPATLAQLEEVILPIISLTLEKENIDFYDDCFEVTDALTFYQKRISPALWQLFGQMYQALKGSGVDFFGEMFNTLDNFVTWGADTFKQSVEHRTMLFDILNIAMTSEHLGPNDRVSGAKLADSILLSLKDSVFDAYPAVLSLVLPGVYEAKKDALQLRKWSSVVVLDMIYVNQQLTLSILESQGETVKFFTALLGSILNTFSRVHEKRVAILGFLSLLSVPVETLPAAVREGLPQVFAGLLQQLDTLPEAILKRKALQDLFEDEDDDEEAEEDADLSGDVNGFDDDKDVFDAENEIQEMLAAESARLQARSAAREAGMEVPEDDDEDVDDDEDEDDEFAFTSPIDEVPVYDSFRSVMTELQNTRADTFNGLIGGLNDDQKATLQKVSALQDKDVNEAEPADLSQDFS